jgi:hypothetical protein
LPLQQLQQHPTAEHPLLLLTTLPLAALLPQEHLLLLSRHLLLQLTGSAAPARPCFAANRASENLAAEPDAAALTWPAAKLLLDQPSGQRRAAH